MIPAHKKDISRWSIWQDYNDAVQLFNAKIQSFPTVIYSRILGFGPKEYFKAAEGADKVPEVKF